MGRVSAVNWWAGWRADAWSDIPPQGLCWGRYGSGDAGAGVHGYVDDWRLESLARGSLRQYTGKSWAVEPDFSVFPSMPLECIRFQIYRSRFAGDLIRGVPGMQGVIPSLTWASGVSASDTSWGIRPGSCVAVRAPGRGVFDRGEWIRGFMDAVGYSEPAHILCFGVYERVRGVLTATGVPWSGEKLHSCKASRARREPLPCRERLSCSL